jgi:glycosyltransferase involved in cell wall biosynthesis
MGKISNKNILIITARSDLGGGPKHVLQLIQNFAQNERLKIHLASPKQEPFYPKYLKYVDSHFSIPSRSFSVISFIRLLFFCKENDIHIIHSHGRGAGVYSRLLSLWGYIIVHTFHGAHNDPSSLGQIKLCIDKFLSPLTSQFICVSESEKEKSLSLGISIPSKIRIIKNGIDFDFKGQEAWDVKEKYSIPPNFRVWGTLARLSSEKGIDIFLKTLLLPEADPNFFFLIAGSGPKLEIYEKFLTQYEIKNVKFLGEISTPLSFLKGLDGYFSFSHGEGLPLSLLEAFACSLPCVISNVSGHNEFSNETDLFDLNDKKNFLIKIKEPKEINYSHIKKEYSESRMIENTTSLYYHISE